MNIGRYLPSAQFTVILGSILLSGGLVVAAQQITHRPASTPTLSTAIPSYTTEQTDWRETLNALGVSSVAAAAQASSTQEVTQNLLSAAATSNVTDTVARTLLVNLSAAKSQGLGSDIPTQDKLIADAVSQIQKQRGAPTYSQKDLTTSANTKVALKAYGNALVLAISRHPEANYPDTLLALSSATDTSDPSKLADLTTIQKGYSALATEVANIHVPPTLLPLHLTIVNDLDEMSRLFVDMKTVFSDPLRGLAGFELYQGLNDELGRVFTSIAQEFAQNGILFTKDEPGSAWGSVSSL